MILDWDEVARVMGAATAAWAPGKQISGWSIDSRTIAPDDLFIALRGENHDGHDYVRAALEKGAVGALVERDLGSGALLIVEDTLAALQKLAGWARCRWAGKVVAVTGSAGKTTTKDVIAHLLAVEMAVGKTIGNLNNHVGLPLSILRLPDESRVAVLEMGMNHAGEIRVLARIARPDVGVVTNVGYAHVEAFGSVEAVARAKRELIEELPADGVAVLNADDPLVSAFREVHGGRVVTFGLAESADVRAEEVELGVETVRFRCGGVRFESPLVGRHGLSNVLAGLAVARVFAIPLERLRDTVRSLAPGKMRGERLEHNGVIIWNDSYNSNPEAARAMIDVLRSTPARRRVAVLGEMLELGPSTEPLHRDIGRYVAAQGIDVLVGIRGAARFTVEEAVRVGLSDGAAYFFEDPAEAGDFLGGMLRDGDAVLFKGSRGVKVERALERVLG
ncbi:MAG TPA: UDP-N-acetylmuramoyl-tripeptide--D-alanyl-D-alanine ligase [Bryobacteraceae bacterium]|nr:UDP-N-acetylmuramoyl-tripeptide--D-alanyl-D-alanine ligase [Bryobacteraceae bacterium]